MPNQQMESMGDLKHHVGLPALAPVHALLTQLSDTNSWWELAFKTRKGGRQLIVHNKHLVQFAGAGQTGGPFKAHAMLISPTGQTRLPTPDFFTLLRAILLGLCDWLDGLETSLTAHLAPRDPAWQWPTSCPFIGLPVGYGPGPTPFLPDDFPLPLCAGSDELPWQ